MSKALAAWQRFKIVAAMDISDLASQHPDRWIFGRFALPKNWLATAVTAAALEFTGIGGSYRLAEQAPGPLRCAVIGAAALMTPDNHSIPSGQSFDLQPGEKMRIGAVTEQNYGYLAVGGGFGVPPILNSRSTHVQAGFGGLEGRHIESGDRLPVSISGVTPEIVRIKKPAYPAAHQNVRVILGAQSAMFPENEIDHFLQAPYTISNRINRMGAYLEGRQLRHKSTPDIVSDGIVKGAIQVPGSGLPIVLLADRQPTGGYPKIATIITADLPTFVQIRPGQTCQFKAVTVEEAVRAYREMIEVLDNNSQLLEPIDRVGGLTSDRLLSHNLISGAVASDQLPWEQPI